MIPVSFARDSTRTIWAIFLLGLNPILLLALFGIELLNPPPALALSSGQVSISLITGPFFTLDSNSPCTQGPSASYIGFRVTNTSGGTLTQMQATLSGLGASFVLTGGQAATQYLGTLAISAYRDVYWFISYACSFNASHTFTVTVSDGNAGTVSGTGTVTTESSISASAGGQIDSSTLGPGYVLGQVVPLTITYNFGNVGSNANLWIQPAGNPTFNAGCFQLVSTSIISSAVTGISAGQSMLYYTNTNTSGSNNLMGVLYNFLYLCNNTSTTARPFAAQNSGTQYKYTGNYETQLVNTFPAGTVPFSMTKSVTPKSLDSTGGVVTYTILVTNTSAFNSLFNGITDTMATSVTFGSVTGSSQIYTANSSRSPSSGSGGTLRWDGQPQSYYAVPSGTAIKLIYTATIPSVVGTYQNTAKANSGATEFGTSSATVQVFSPTAVRLSNFSASSIEDPSLILGIAAIFAVGSGRYAFTYVHAKKRRRKRTSQPL